MEQEPLCSPRQLWCITEKVGISPETFLEHFEPVLFTFTTCVALFLPVWIWNRVYPYIKERLDSRAAMTRRRQRRTQQQATEAAEMSKYDDLHHISSFTHPCHPQLQSPLFNPLPAEIRDMIYSYTFADHEDLEHPYDFDTCYRRPGYFAPRKSHTALLQTCQAIYTDRWFMPWTSAQHTFFLAWQGRRPDKSTTAPQMARTVRLIERLHADVPARRKEIANIQIFAQLCELEGGGALSKILNIEQFRPRHVTITVRHTDTWGWEDDVSLFIGSDWVWKCRFPSSVTRICFQLESLERKKEQVDSVMGQIQEGWYFTRTDGVHMVPAVIGSTWEVWVGSSTWEGERWIRDEDDLEPGKIRQCIASLCFIPADMADTGSRAAHENRARRGRLEVPQDIVDRTMIRNNEPSLNVGDMRDAGVTDGTSSSEALRMVQKWRYEEEE